MAKWMMYSKKADFQEIAARHGVDQVIARILVNRGVTEETQIRQYLHPSADDLMDGSRMRDMEKAVSLLRTAVTDRMRIRIIGDYDIDGIQATYILHQGLLRVGALVDYAVPNRMEDGYGLNVSMIEQCIADGVGLVVTCDNGIAAAEAIAAAKEAGLMVIVTDHHEVPYTMEQGHKCYHLPPADAIVNPKQADCPYPFKQLCGAAVAWKVIRQLYPVMGIAKKEADCFLENAAFATVGDVMQLQGENRSLVALGLKQLQQTSNLGMRTLIERCGIQGKMLSAYHIGFILGPCLNASGRLDSATKAIELLETSSAREAVALADALQSLNEQRKVMTEQGVKAAIAYVEDHAQSADAVLVVYLPKVHESVAGIIAGRLREQYERPVFVLVDAADGEGVKGSGRSVEGYSMYDEMCKCSELFTRFGGHPMAAGLSLPKENVDAFRRKINAVCELSTEQMQTVIHIDVPMPFSYLTPERIRQLDLLEPFGNGNPKPVFAQKNVTVLRRQPMGKNGQYTRMELRGEDGGQIEGLYFGDVKNVEDVLSEKGKITVAYYPQINTYRGTQKMQVVISQIC